MAAFTMPSLGADMEDGTLLEWRVAVGDRVARGDIVALVETRKGAIEIEVYEDGWIQELSVAEGGKVPVGATLAVIGSEAPPGAAPAPGAPQAPAAAALPPRALPAAPAPAPAPALAPAAAYHSSILPPPPSQADRVRSSPSARKRAHELGLDLHDIAGTGPGGAVLRPDVEAAAAAPPPPPPAEPSPPPATVAAPPSPAPARPHPTRPAVDPMRLAIASAMARANREIPHYHLARELDLGRAMAWLAAHNAARPILERMLPAALLIKATALALRAHPELNGWWRSSPEAPEGRFDPGPGVHPGIAVSLRGGGLVIPALLDADQLPLEGLMAAMSDLVLRAREGRLRSRELSAGTITITSLGDLGVDLVHGLIYPPQVALVGFGQVADRPWVADGQVVPRATVFVTLAADHRATDGHTGGRFLEHLARLLAEPEEL